MPESKESQVALVVIKLKVQGQPCFLMRKNRKWEDISFIGGHVEDRDAGSFERSAYRELLEEVPPLRVNRDFNLTSLTSQIRYGPVYSRSANTTVNYDLQFFLVVFRNSPEIAIASLGQRSLNVLLTENELLKPSLYRIAALVEVLNTQHKGGLSAIPYSWPGDIDSADIDVAQSALAFK
jgi:8-oxo-dGTP pyrophosphatase MutT (NUDIX family)